MVAQGVEHRMGQAHVGGPDDNHVHGRRNVGRVGLGTHMAPDWDFCD